MCRFSNALIKSHKVFDTTEIDTVHCPHSPHHHLGKWKMEIPIFQEEINFPYLEFLSANCVNTEK